MTLLAYAARKFLAQQSDVTSLLGVDELGDPMIYVNHPGATIENTQNSMIVLTVFDGWGANNHNDARFPVLTVDIWSDPTRNSDGSVRRKDADLKIEAVYKAVDRHLHQVSNSLPNGDYIFWDDERIISSSRQNEPSLRPAFDDEGAMMGTINYNVTI